MTFRIRSAPFADRDLAIAGGQKSNSAGLKVVHRQGYGIAEIEIARIFHLEPQIEWRLFVSQCVEIVGADDEQEVILRFVGIGIFDGGVDGSPRERIERFAGSQLLGPACNEPGGNTPGLARDEERDVEDLRGLVGDTYAERWRLGLSKGVAENRQGRAW